MSKLRIGYFSTTPVQILDGLSNYFEDLQIFNESIESYQLIEDNLLNEKITIAICPLNKIPIERREEVVIAALTKRENPSEVLVLKNEKAVEGKVLKLSLIHISEPTRPY